MSWLNARKPVGALSGAVGAAALDAPGGYRSGKRWWGLVILATFPALAWWLRDVFAAALPSWGALWTTFPYLLSLFVAWALLRRATYQLHRSWNPFTQILPRIPGAALASWLGVPLSIALVAVLWLVGGLCGVYAVALYTALIMTLAAYRARRRLGRIAAALDLAATALRVPDSSLEKRVRVRGRVVYLRPTARARERVVNAPDEVDSALAAVTGGEAYLEDGLIVISPYASDETRERRDVMELSAGIVTKIDEDEGGWTLTLAPGTSPARAEQVSVFVASHLNGASLVGWEPYSNTARAEMLSDRVRLVRQRLSELLKVDPWRLDVKIEDGAEHIESVEVYGAPSTSADPAKRRQLWQALVYSLPDGSNGWQVDENAMSGDVRLTYGPPRALPDTVALGDVLPAAPSDDWATIPLGIGETGEPVGLNLVLGPHGLLAGPTGSGKTVALLADAAQRLMRGHDLLICDPTKSGLDFASILPYARGVATDSIASVVDLLEAAYAEGVRRKGILAREGEVKWSDLSPAVREREDIRPLTILIDELGSLLIAPDVPKALPKDDPRRIELEEQAAQKATIRLIIGNIARELRFVGVFLLLALQRPDVAILGSGELRSNLTSSVQLAKPGAVPSRDALAMLFSGDTVGEAHETLLALDSGHHHGLAVTAGDGGGLAGFRVAFSPMRDVPALLEARGVFPANRPPLVAPAKPEPVEDLVFGRRIIEDEPTEEVIVRDAAGLDLSGAFAGPDAFGDLFD